MHLACNSLLIFQVPNKPEYWIEKLQMTPHPEGGFFKETYRCAEQVEKKNLPKRFPGDRNFSTAIYFLLIDPQISKLHRIKSDEMWHFYEGSGALIYSIDPQGILTEHKLGINPNEGEMPQILIPAGCWFGARVNRPGSYCLTGCTVSPGFHFDDFELGERNNLIELFPDHDKIIRELT